jgi:hypothetical protein
VNAFTDANTTPLKGPAGDERPGGGCATSSPLRDDENFRLRQVPALLTSLHQCFEILRQLLGNNGRPLTIIGAAASVSSTGIIEALE